MRFILLVEGYTERDAAAAFLKRWLDRRLPKPVGIRTDRFEGWPEFCKRAPQKAQAYLDSPESGEIIAVIGLLDLYGPACYPDQVTEARERYQWGVSEMVSRVDRDRFRMFFAVHEFEAWLLSQPGILPFTPSNPETTRMQNPEAINFREPPSHLLDRLYQRNGGRHYKKTTHGKQLFNKLDPETAYEKCPHLKEMLDEMLRLAQQAGQ